MPTETLVPEPLRSSLPSRGPLPFPRRGCAPCPAEKAGYGARAAPPTEEEAAVSLAGGTECLATRAVRLREDVQEARER